LTFLEKEPSFLGGSSDGLDTIGVTNDVRMMYNDPAQYR
jgi:hypothetical protein